MNNILSSTIKKNKILDPDISVLLPIYNGEKYLIEAIESILGQTFINFELLILDDGSTDASLSILRKYEEKDARITVITRENRGLPTTLNELIDMARGKWLARMDQDDISHPNRFARQIQLMESNNADICGCHWVVMNEAGKYIDVNLAPLCDDTITICLAETVPFAHGSVMMRKDFILQHSLKYGARRYAEDYDLWIKFYENGAKFMNVNEFLFTYRDYATSLSKRKYKELTADTKNLKFGFIRRNVDACLNAVQNLSSDFSKLSLNERINLLLASYRVSLVIKKPLLIRTIRLAKRRSVVMTLIELLK